MRKRIWIEPIFGWNHFSILPAREIWNRQIENEALRVDPDRLAQRPDGPVATTRRQNKSKAAKIFRGDFLMRILGGSGQQEMGLQIPQKQFQACREQLPFPMVQSNP